MSVFVCMYMRAREGVSLRACALTYPSMQRACAILPSAVSLAPPLFSTFAHKRQDFRKKI